ncbi:hypothetical protein N7446_013201 [Penicillium canescens]|nr:hypothetical protein N7446_013201 [Penicillium canescens]
MRTYNRDDSLAVTRPTTYSLACGLSMAERTGSPVFYTLWSYVLVTIYSKTIYRRTSSSITPADVTGTRYCD